ncbi:hypothetical protein [Halobaculum sp. EA56]
MSDNHPDPRLTFVDEHRDLTAGDAGLYDPDAFLVRLESTGGE